MSYSQRKIKNARIRYPYEASIWCKGAVRCHLSSVTIAFHSPPLYLCSGDDLTFSSTFRWKTLVDGFKRCRALHGHHINSQIHLKYSSKYKDFVTIWLGLYIRVIWTYIRSSIDEVGSLSSWLSRLANGFNKLEHIGKLRTK